ncbi:MAG: hypothetical protein HY936_00750 [Nitrosomonadales bacterium]|nr:hypothetical protein [Nitrosomonadales bacterium]
MRNCTYEENIDRVREIGNDVSRSANAATLELLRNVDTVVDRLSKLQDIYAEHIRVAREAADHIKHCKPNRVIDPKDVACDLLSAAEGALQVQVAVLRKGLASAYADVELRGSNKEAVISEYKRTITVTADLHNSVLDLRWAIMEHDVDLEKPGSKQYTDVDEMFKDMGL